MALTRRTVAAAVPGCVPVAAPHAATSWQVTAPCADGDRHARDMRQHLASAPRMAGGRHLHDAARIAG